MSYISRQSSSLKHRTTPATTFRHRSLPMRAPILCAVFALATSSAGSHESTNTAPVAPCTTATAACVQWVTLGGGPARSLVYSTHSLDAPNTAVTRALIMVHGAGRNADHYFAPARNAAATHVDVRSDCIDGAGRPERISRSCPPDARSPGASRIPGQE